MSYKDALSDLERGGERSLTQQLVDGIATAIESGELEPDEKLPPTRELAELAGVNHLTAVRAYRRLRELGLVSAHVGRGTFVRGAGRQPETRRVADSIAWQRYALPEYEPGYGDRVLADMHRQATARDLLPLSVGYPSARIFPVEAIGEAFEATLRERAGEALQYSEVQGLAELAEQIAALSAARDAPEDPADILITNGASQGLALACRAILRPGDVVACEDPTFPSVIRAVQETGARIVGVPVDEHGLDIDALAALLAREEIKALALQSRLHNPTGRDLVPARREALLALARRHGFFILEDGVYAELRFDGEQRPLAACAGAGSRRLRRLALEDGQRGPATRLGRGQRPGPRPDHRREARRRHPQPDRYPARRRPLPRLRGLPGPGRARPVALSPRLRRPARGDRRAPRPDRLLRAAARRRACLGSPSTSALDERELVEEAVRHGVAYAPGGAMRVERRPELSLRLSFGYLEPDALVEGVRRLAAAAAELRRRPPRRQAMPL